MPETRFEKLIAKSRRVASMRLRELGRRIFQDRRERDQPGGYPSLLGTRYVDNQFLGGGTADSTTFLRGDYAWVAAPTTSGLASSTVGSSGGSLVGVQSLTSTYDTLADLIDVTNSTGVISGGVLTDAGSGTINVSSGFALVRTTNAELGTLVVVSFAALTGQALTNNSPNFVYADYNAGTPALTVSTTFADDFRRTLVGIVYRTGTRLDISNVNAPATNISRKLTRRMALIYGVQRASGALIAATGTRNFSISAASLWLGLSNLTTTAFDSSGAGTFSYWYRDGVGGYTEVASSTQINNTQYDNGSGALATLSNNHYGVHWVYLDVDSNVHVVYGQGDYTATTADAATVPTSVSPIINQFHSLVVGKIIIKKSDAAFTATLTPFTTTFSGSGSSGDVAGPASSTDDRIATFDGVSGKIIQDGGSTIADVLATANTAAEADVATHAALATGVHGHTVGTSMPGSPANGDTCYRTDLDTEFTYDGTRWLSQPFPVCIGSVRGSAVSTFNPGPGGLASDDANSPIIFGRTVRILSISSGLRGGTGARVWTTRLRLDGSGSDSFACSNTITSVAATWVLAAQEAVGLSLTATNRLNVLTNATGGSETYGYAATLTCAWEST